MGPDIFPAYQWSKYAYKYMGGTLRFNLLMLVNASEVLTLQFTFLQHIYDLMLIYKYITN